MASLVSAAIDNLPIENVKIVDTKGNLLSNSLNTDANDASIVSEHQQIKRSIETDLENKVVNLLGAIYGHDKVFASVNTQLNFDAIEKEEIEFDLPEGSGEEKGLIRSQQEEATGNSGISKVEGSVLEDNNVTEFPDGEDGDNSSYNHTTNYELDSSTSHVIKAPGNIESVTASVVINTADDGRNLELLVRNALGINPELDNSGIEIEYVGLVDEKEDQFISPDFDFLTMTMNWLSSYWWIVLIGLAVIIIIIVVVRLLLNRRRDSEEEEYEEVESPIVVEEKIEENVLTEEMKAKQRENQISKEKEDTVRKEAKDNPELVAELLKIWLNEED